MTETMRRAKALLAAGWTNPEPTLWELDVSDPRLALVGAKERVTGEDFSGATYAGRRCVQAFPRSSWWPAKWRAGLRHGSGRHGSCLEYDLGRESSNAAQNAGSFVLSRFARGDCESLIVTPSDYAAGGQRANELH
jgi:hypothetical protein